MLMTMMSMATATFLGCECTATWISPDLNKVNSADFNQIRALVAGDLNQYMGFNIIRTERIGTVTSNSQTCDSVLAFHRRGIGLCIWEDIVARVTERPDKRFSQYIYYRMTLGATRLEEERVVQIACLQGATS